MSVTTESRPIGHPHEKVKLPTARLGEELPIFCERCGYSLHGLPQTTCEHCTIRQFHCPECGHHQPINTLRPAVQTVLGRLRATALVGVVIFKIGFFAIMLIASAGMGGAWAYRYHENAYQQTANGYVQVAARMSPITFADVNLDRVLAFAVFSFAFGCLARMLLLRWKRGALVGAAVAVLVMAAMTIGASFDYWDSLDSQFPVTPPYGGGLLFLLGYAAFWFVFAGAVVWPIWCGLVKAFLPRRAATALLDWQRSMSNPNAPDHIRSALAREHITPR